MKTHKDLDAWKSSVEFVTQMYKITESFPKSEEFGLKDQLRRAAVSIPSNIAEGAARNHTKEFIQFLYISLGSLSEVETQLIIAQNLNYITNGKWYVYSNGTSNY
ncbi:MAG TPA: four helix bundle protein [Bacteroidales bacterium]|nr:four helix bundle protein [Bacteroidales bacterium]